jgi:hypothetical protein
MGYYEETGLVGKYRGYNVYMIWYEEFQRGEDGVIYAVKYHNNKKDFDLVLDGKKIGTMNITGQVNIYPVNRQVPFKYWEAPKKKVEEKKIEILPRNMEVRVSEPEYYDTRVVDNFFKGLKQLWQEIDESLKMTNG